MGLPFFFDFFHLSTQRTVVPGERLERLHPHGNYK